MNPLSPPYQQFMQDLEALRRAAAGLGLSRTSADLYDARQTAEREIMDLSRLASAADSGTVDFTVGPIREQQP